MKTLQAAFVKRWMPLKYRARNLALLIYNKRHDKKFLKILSMAKFWQIAPNAHKIKVGAKKGHARADL